MAYMHPPACPGWSTMVPDEAEVEGAMGVYVGRALPGLHGLERSPLNRAAAALQARLAYEYESLAGVQIQSRHWQLPPRTFIPY